MSALTVLYQDLYHTYSQKYGKDTCIFLLVGKFYELYSQYTQEGEPVCEMVRKATSIMNILLKEKQGHGKNGELGLWSGVPEISLHKFAQMLTREGWYVVIVDQVKDKLDQVIDRIPTRILSPGTHVEMATQDRLTNATLWLNTPNVYAISMADLTTGEVISCYSTVPDDIMHFLQVYNCKEVVIFSPKKEESFYRSKFAIHGLIHFASTSNEISSMSQVSREEFFTKSFTLKSLLPVRKTLNLSESKNEIDYSLTAILQFIYEHSPATKEKLTSHSIFNPSAFMRLSNNILEQLNIITFNGQKSVLNLLEKTHSAIGKRALRERILRPITDENELERRWNEVAWAKHLSYTNLKEFQILERSMKSLYDLTRLHYKLAEGKINAEDILQMFETYSGTKALMKLLKTTPIAPTLDLESYVIDFSSHVKKLLDEGRAQKVREDSGIVNVLTPISGPRTLELENRISSLTQKWIEQWNGILSFLRLTTNPFTLVYKGDDEWIWEGPRMYGDAIKEIGRKPNSPFKNLVVESKKSGPISVMCDEFNHFLSQLRTLYIQMKKTHREELLVVCDDLWEQVSVFHSEWIDWLGRVDCTLALGSVAKEYRWCKPCLGDHLEVSELRHPLLETAQNRLEYISHNVALGGENPSGWLIYGVNASGKSSLMKAIGISCLLAQAGCFVPATSFTLRPYDAAFSRIWNTDSIWAGLSSFAVEVAELKDILSLATSRSLVLGDEVCSGTESLSATSLVASVLEYLDSKQTHFLFATHLHDLMKIEGFNSNKSIAVWHLRVRDEGGKLIYERTLQPGAGNTTYGLEVAKAMGLPYTLLERAHQIRRSLGGEASDMNAPKSIWNAKIQRNECEACQKRNVRFLEVHHITPRCEGGDNSLRNLVVLCEECHDKHHNDELDIGPLQQTSDGPQRVITSKGKGKEKEKEIVNSTEKIKGPIVTVKKLKKGEKGWTQEEQEIILATVKALKGRPVTRIINELLDQGLKLTPAQVNRFIQY